ncbi:hypothetical protein [Desulfosporosinus lacus]|uniref:Uncharacterized protein n=1 Tax=Desulfosporosinus lacus DSM 15449 TaxID=1121420 RepID=A0A1M5WGU8_9FIRM|nr:hypothetical protein [Desulfosporosinus lacus]SHH86705.1 hypothetical protein SAMN02746098_01612 [Desulfosporosinus lacus DSM 15449]
MDNKQNILGYNSDNNQFESTLVTADPDGSIIERLEDVKEKMGRCVSLGQAAASLTGTATKFTVTGIVKVTRLGALVTTAIPAGANTLKFSFTPTGSTAKDLCAATDTASAGAQQLFLVDGVKATALTKCTDVGIGVLAANANMPLILGPGVIQTIYSAGAPATGALTLFVEYEPLVPGAMIS